MKIKAKPDIDELQKECLERGLSTKGSAKELKERIKHYDADSKENLFDSSGTVYNNLMADFIMPKNRFLVQLKLANLSMYFVHGCLYPANQEQSVIYREQNRKPDLLNQFPDHIPLAKGVIQDFDETEVLVEVILSAEELQNIQSIDSILFFDGLLPISRVTAIYFANNSTKSSFLASVDVFPDAFVPASICHIVPEKIETVKLADTKLVVPTTNRWTIIFEKFDRLLGLIAFLKNTSLFYTNSTNEYVEYTPGYFQVLSLINNQGDGIPKENSFFRWIINPESLEIDGKLARFQFKEIINAIYNNLEFDIDWGLHLIEKCIAIEQSNEEIEQLRSIAKLLFDYKKMRIDYRAILSSPFIQKNIPIIILIFLIKFPNKALGHSDKQAFKNYFRTNDVAIERNHAEYIFAVMGLYYGYSNLVKEDRVDMSDPFFNMLAKGNGQIKFKLDTFLDRFTIESIYEFSKGGGERLSTPMEFLNVVKTPSPVKLQVPRSFDVEYIDQSYNKYGKQIVSFRRISANIAIARELTNLYGDQITQYDHAFTYIFKYYPELLSVKTEHLAKLIAENSNNNTLTELRDSIDMDKKYGKSRSKR